MGGYNGTNRSHHPVNGIVATVELARGSKSGSPPQSDSASVLRDPEAAVLFG